MLWLLLEEFSLQFLSDELCLERMGWRLVLFYYTFPYKVHQIFCKVSLREMYNLNNDPSIYFKPSSEEQNFCLFLYICLGMECSPSEQLNRNQNILFILMHLNTQTGTILLPPSILHMRKQRLRDVQQSA